MHLSPFQYLRHTLHPILSTIGLACITCIQIHAQTEVSGQVSGHWTIAASPYLIINDAVVSSGQTLEIDPGVVVQFRDADDDLLIDGTLLVNGLENAPVIFTADNAIKEPGQWGGILLRQGSDASLLSHAVVEFGGGFRAEQLRIENASPTLQSIKVRSGRSSGLGVFGGSPSVTGMTFSENVSFAATFGTDAFPSIQGSSASGNGTDAIGRHGGTVSQSGIWKRDDIPYTIINDIFIPFEETLIIEPGTIVQFRDADDDLWVDGVLLARGTSTQPIRFTSNDAEATSGQWGAVLVRDQGEQERSEFISCIFEYGGGFRNGMLHCQNAHPLVQSSTFQFSRLRGIELSEASPAIHDTLFQQNPDYAAGMNTQSFPFLTDNRAENNGKNAVAVFGGTINATGTWHADNLPFSVTNDVLIAEEGNLTISPGSTILFQDADDDLIVDGTLIAQGTTGKPITFTSDEEEKSPGQWGAIVMRASSNDQAMIFHDCVVEYGGGFHGEMMLVSSVSPTIQNTQFIGSRARGLTLNNSDSLIAHSSFLNNAGSALGMNLSSFPRWDSISAMGNGADAITVDGGTLSDIGTWHASAVPYTLMNDVTISQNATLTIEPGTTVQFQDSDDDLKIDGALIASGTRDAPITFTSNDSKKSPGQWGALLFSDSSNDGISILEAAVFEYGGGFRSGAVELNNANPVLRDSEFHHARAHGLVIRGGNPSIERSVFRENSDSGIHSSTGAIPSIRESTFTGNGGDGITNSDTSVIVDAIGNFWGDPSGPLDTRNDDSLDQTNPNATGDKVSEFVRWQPFLGEAPHIPTPLEARIRIDLESIDFGQWAVNESAARDIQITNDGLVDLIIHDARATSPFEGLLPGSPLTIQPRTTSTVTVLFRPVSPGVFSGNITFGSNAGNQPELSVALAGEAIAPINRSPVLTALDPGQGTAGTEVTLTGTNFSPSLNENIVRIGAFTAELISISPVELVATIPAGLSPGTFDISVTTGNGESNPLSFEVLAPPVAPSPLRIELSDPGQAIISWDPTSPASQLQTTPAMEPPVNWTNYEGAIQLTDGRMRTTVATSEPNTFFRLSTTENQPPTQSNGPGTLRLPDDWTPTFEIIDQNEVFIQPALGGSVQLKNGAKVSLPAGALSEGAHLRIVQLDFSEYTTNLKRDIYQIDAEGQPLLRPATIQLPYKHLNAEGNVAVFHADPGDPAEELQPDFNADIGLLQVEVMQFSIFDVEDTGDYGETFKDVILDTSRSRILDVPYYSQNLRQWCFAAASQMILKYQGVDVEPWDIAKYFDLSFDKGASIWQLWAGHYRRLFTGMGAQVRETTGWLAPENLNGYLIRQIDDGRPVFLVIRHAIHAIVVVGYSQAGVFIHDPSGDALKYGKGASPPRNQWSRQFLNWDEWSKVINLWPTPYTPIAVPSWAIVLENTRSEEASTATITLPSASINAGRAGNGYIEIDRNDAPNAQGQPGGISESHFFWNGKKPLGYEFLPNKGFAPPLHASINDSLILKADVSNSGTSPIPVSLRVLLGNDIIFELATPRVIPATTNNQLIEIFERLGNFRFTDTPTPIQLGSHTLNYQLLANGNVVDEIPVVMEIGPGRPAGVQKAPAQDGIRVTWESVPESSGHRIEYIVTDGFTRRTPTVGRSLYIPSAQGGNLSSNYYVLARDVSSGLEGPRSGPAILNAAQTYSLAEGPTATGNIDVTTTGASVLSGPNLQSVSWTAPPGTLVAGETFSIDITATPSGAPFKYAPSGPFRGRSTPPGLHPARVGASVTLNPNAPEKYGLPSGGAIAGYFRVSLDECPPDPATLMYCYETTKDDHSETLKVPEATSEFWVVISVSGLDANTTFGEGLVIWKYVADN